MVTDRQEEAVDSDIHVLLIGLAEALDKVGTLHAIVPEEPHRIVLVEDGDTLVLLDTLAHDVRGTEVVLTHARPAR